MREATVVLGGVLGVLALMLPAGARAQDREPVFDPVQGYRITHYRGVVAPVSEGVVRIDTAQAGALWARKAAIFIDVNPAAGAVRDSDTGHWALAEPHSSIPGAHWFPEAGRGKLADGIGPWFVDGIGRLSKANPGRPIVVFCLADCWMSWNAALRLHRAGYADGRWFADGLDGWKEAELALVPAKLKGLTRRDRHSA